MSQPNINNQEEWLKVLGKGMITLPKKWRKELNIAEGDIVKARKQGDKVVIQSRNAQSVPYRVYTDKEIDEFLEADKLPHGLTSKINKKFSPREIA